MGLCLPADIAPAALPHLPLQFSSLPQRHNRLNTILATGTATSYSRTERHKCTSHFKMPHCSLRLQIAAGLQFSPDQVQGMLALWELLKHALNRFTGSQTSCTASSPATG